MTIVTDVRVRPGAEDKWDAVVRDRMAAAKERPGWVGAQLLRSESQPNHRVIVGTWRTRADWEAWHRDPRFTETRRQFDELIEGPEHRGWHEVVLDVRSGPAHATCYDDHHVTPEQEAEAALDKETQAQVDRYKADLEARKTIRRGFEETLTHQQNWRDEKSVEFPDDGRNAISAAGIEAFRRWFTKLPDDDPRVLRLLRALQRLYAGPNTSMSPCVEDLVGRFQFDNDAEESVEAFLDRLTVAVENQ